MTEQKLEGDADLLRDCNRGTDTSEKQIRLREKIIEKELSPKEWIWLRIGLSMEDAGSLLLCYKMEVSTPVCVSPYAIGDSRTDWKEALEKCRMDAKKREDVQKVTDTALLANPCDE